VEEKFEIVSSDLDEFIAYCKEMNENNLVQRLFNITDENELINDNLLKYPSNIKDYS